MSKPILIIGALALAASFALPVPAPAGERYALITFHGDESDISDHGLTMQDCVDAIEAARLSGVVATCRTERVKRPGSVKGAISEEHAATVAESAQRVLRGSMGESAKTAGFHGFGEKTAAATP
jgi:hypothetical protein